MSDDLKNQVRTWYAEAARAAAGAARAAAGASKDAPSGCCGSAPGCGCGCGGTADVRAGGAVDAEIRVGGGLYAPSDLAGLPRGAVAASLGCGVPTALVDLHPGETVLDLGSGGGIDVLLAARRVGPTGKVYGLDMTDEMLALARENQLRAGATNVEFLKGDIEAIPLSDDSVEVVISNCVINLSTDKDRVFREAFRVLKPGGRLAVSDTVFQGDMNLIPGWIRRSPEAWSQCVSGSLEERDYLARLRAVGFLDPSVQVTQVYAGSVLPAGVRLVSGFIRARKPD